MVRKVDELGRIVLPMDFRKALNISKDCGVKMELKDGYMILSPAECVCSICKTVIPTSTKYGLCEECIQAIRKEA